jgi:hypothetical protein
MEQTITQSYWSVNNPQLMPGAPYSLSMREELKYKDFGVRFSMALREAEPKLPKTNKELGKIFDVSAPMITYMRTGQKMPSMETARLIAMRCGVCMEWLLTGRGPKYPEITAKQITPAANILIKAIPDLADSQLNLLAGMVREFLSAPRKADD